MERYGMMITKMAGAIIAGVVSLIVVIVLILVIVQPWGNSASGFTGVKVFADPDVSWTGDYSVNPVGSLTGGHSGDLGGQGNSVYVIDCPSGFSMRVTVYPPFHYDLPALEHADNATIESWVRGEMRERNSGSNPDAVTVGAEC